MNQGHIYGYSSGPEQNLATEGMPRIPEVPAGVSRVRSEAELNRKLTEELMARLNSAMRPSPPVAQADNLKIAQSPQSDLGVNLDDLGRLVSGSNNVLRDILHRLEL